jgi:hypothetical protein
MVIRGKRIRSLARHVGPAVQPGTKLVVALTDPAKHLAAVKRAGFDDPLVRGERLLPGDVGPATNFNAEGGWDIHKDREMETAYRVTEWTWTEWHGRDQVERTDFRNLPYKRYPRTKIPPPSMELEAVEGPDGDMLLISPTFTYQSTNSALLNAINVFLELFGECTIMTDQLSAFVRSPTRRLNWIVLPPGKQPWPALAKRLDGVVKRQPQGNQRYIRHRLEVINSYDPEFHAVGRAGFSGYVVFGFPNLDLYVLESIHIGNATYVFEQDWESLSQLTKVEILSQGLHKERIVHLKSWDSTIEQLLKATP